MFVLVYWDISEIQYFYFYYSFVNKRNKLQVHTHNDVQTHTTRFSEYSDKVV